MKITVNTLLLGVLLIAVTTAVAYVVFNEIAAHSEQKKLEAFRNKSF